jgi:N utilization substance protein A
MPSKKRKKKSSQAKSKTATSKPAKKVSRKGRATAPKITAKKRQLKKKTSSKESSMRERKTTARRTQVVESSSAGKSASVSEQSGDLEGLSRSEQADSESVDELVGEGNAFEAGAVAGVEEADGQDEREVHTHEVPEDDVPDEYLDKD